MKSRTTEYRMLHYWVERQLGKPNYCLICKDTTKQRYEWANISGEYRKVISDWRRLCVACHRIEDNQMLKRVCKNGHNLTEDNIYMRPSGKHRECRVCRRILRYNYNPSKSTNPKKEESK